MAETDVVPKITIQVLCFAQIKEQLGRSEFSFTLQKGSRGHDLLAHLLQQNPSLKGLLSVSRLAVNCDYASADRVLQEGDEVVIIPPVSGG